MKTTTQYHQLKAVPPATLNHLKTTHAVEKNSPRNTDSCILNIYQEFHVMHSKL